MKSSHKQGYTLMEVVLTVSICVILLIYGFVMYHFIFKYW